MVSSNQDAFIKGDVKIMVATSAFGMGVYKKDVEMVIHYDISDSLSKRLIVFERKDSGEIYRIEANPSSTLSIDLALSIGLSNPLILCKDNLLIIKDKISFYPIEILSLINDRFIYILFHLK